MKRAVTHTELIGVAMLLLGIGVFADIFTGRFSPPALMFSIVLLLLGRHYKRKRKQMRANVLLLVGVMTLAGQLFSSVAFQLLLAALLLYGGFQLLQSRRHPLQITIEEKQSTAGRIVKRQPFLRNALIGTYRMTDHVYELEDMNVRYGVGDVHIDLSMAMIAEGETVLVIHGTIGNIRLYVPYDVELSLNHSAVIGQLSVLGEQERGMNQNVVLRTEGYAAASRRIKIVTSLLVGNTEVRYV